MDNFKRVLTAALIFASLTGCSDNNQTDAFFKISVTDQQTVHYRDVHHLTLTISDITKAIDESAFNPVFKCHFQLENINHGPWDQAWVAFNISLQIGSKIIASIKRAGVLQNHIMDIHIQHNLPNFGYDIDDVEVKVTPIAWMPSYPLIIDTPASNAEAITIETP